MAIRYSTLRNRHGRHCSIQTGNNPAWPEAGAIVVEQIEEELQFPQTRWSTAQLKKKYFVKK